MAKNKQKPIRQARIDKVKRLYNKMMRGVSEQTEELNELSKMVLALRFKRATPEQELLLSRLEKEIAEHDRLIKLMSGEEK